jgi:hypothetical protein
LEIRRKYALLLRDVHQLRLLSRFRRGSVAVAVREQRHGRDALTALVFRSW